MVDYVTIANLALSKIGAEDTISDPDQDSTAARAIRVAWDSVRKAMIRGGELAPRWNFAMKYFQTPARNPTDADPVPFGWTAAFPKPDGALRLVEILDPPCSAAGSWLFAGNEVLLNETGPLKAWWLIDVENPVLWDALFIDTFAARLAFQIADKIAGDTGRKFACRDEYEKNLKAAAKVDAVENPPIDQDESDWITCRYQMGGRA